MRIELLKKKFWYYRVVSSRNGKILLTSETYRTRFSARRAATKMARANNLAVIERTK